jgi:zinc finger SWIM domain-containing protein 3
MMQRLREKNESVKTMREVVNAKFNMDLDYIMVKNTMKRAQKAIFGDPSFDAKNLIEILKKLQKDNYKLEFNYSTCKEGELENLFWATSSMIRNLHYYGDIIICDTTFGMNRFSMPLMLLLGVDHEFCTVCFGFALTRSEESDNFCWVFQQLRRIVIDTPRIIITDACPSFNKAIAQEFPLGMHILCGWHLSQNLKKHFAFLNTNKGESQ